MGKILPGESDEVFYEISSFLPVEKFFPAKFLPIMHVKIAQTIKYLSITFRYFKTFWGIVFANRRKRETSRRQVFISLWRNTDINKNWITWKLIFTKINIRGISVIEIILSILCNAFLKRPALFRYNILMSTRESKNFMALKFLANASELLQRCYDRRGSQVIVSIKILKRKYNVKAYYLSYHYVINWKVCKVQCCSKKLNSLKIYKQGSYA